MEAKKREIKMEKVSVIIPVYNSDKYLEETLKSIVEQSLKEIEIICIDDGSTDSSVNIIKKFSQMDNRIKILYQKHKGGGAARNLGLTMARGKYVSFLDADDFFDRTMLEKAYKKCEEHNAEICVYGVNCYNQNSKQVYYEISGLRDYLLPSQQVFSWRDFPDYIFNSFHNWPWNKMFLRSFLDVNHIRFQEIWRTNDLLFTNVALVKANKITIIREPLVNYRIQISNNCQSTNFLYPYDFYKAFTALKEFLIKEGIWLQVKKSFQNHALEGALGNLDSIEFHENHKNLYVKLKNEIFIELELTKLEKQDVYNEYVEKWERMQKILKQDYTEYLMNRATEYKMELRNYKNELQCKDKEIKKIKMSITFRVGRAILYFPHCLKKIIKTTEGKI